MAGYSGTPLPHKLGIKEGSRVRLAGAPVGFAHTLGSGAATDLTESEVRTVGLAAGLVDNKVCAIDEVWSGTMLLYSPWLWPNLGKLPLSPKGEYYLPDLVNLARAQHLSVQTTLTEDEEEVLGVNDRAQLARANAVLRRRKIDQLLASGVTIVDPDTTYVEPEVDIKHDATIQPGCHLRGRTRIAHDCGRALNPANVEGQVEGSAYMGYGEIIGEEQVFRGGLHKKPSLLDYKIPTSLDTPALEAIIVESVDAEGPFGAKEAGEGPLNPVIPAIANAVYDAIGVRFDETPITAEKILNALGKRDRRGEPKSRIGPDGLGEQRSDAKGALRRLTASTDARERKRPVN